MTPEYKSLLMRCNRLLGTALVEQNLVKLEDLEKANERLLEVIGAKQTRQFFEDGGFDVADCRNKLLPPHIDHVGSFCFLLKNFKRFFVS